MSGAVAGLCHLTGPAESGRKGCCTTVPVNAALWGRRTPYPVRIPGQPQHDVTTAIWLLLLVSLVWGIWLVPPPVRLCAWRVLVGVRGISYSRTRLI